MALPGIPIPETQCIGDSLFSINNALTALDSSVIELINAGASVTVSTTAPGGASLGDLWYDSDNGILSVYYDLQWVDVGAGGGGGGSSVTVSDTPPSGASAGDLWFDSTSGVTSIYYDSQWLDVGGGDSGTSAGSVNGIVQCDGNGNFSAAVAGTDYLNNASPVAAKAWVNFGEANIGTVVIKNNFNISSITKNSTGDFTLNFTSPMTNTNYVVIGSGTDSTLSDFPSIVVVSMTNSTTYDLKTTNQVRVQTRGGTVYPVVPANPWDVNITIFGN